jgi:hypothetical protein
MPGKWLLILVPLYYAPLALDFISFFNTGLRPAVRDDRPFGAYVAIYDARHFFKIGMMLNIG